MIEQLLRKWWFPASFSTFGNLVQWCVYLRFGTTLIGKLAAIGAVVALVTWALAFLTWRSQRKIRKFNEYLEEVERYLEELERREREMHDRRPS